MIRIVALAALAAASIAAPASAHDIRVSTSGKTEVQLTGEIRLAARAVCAKAVRNETFRAHAMQACVADTVEASLTKTQLAAL